MRTMPEVPEQIAALGENFTRLWAVLPELVSRAKIAEVLPVYSARTLANMDSLGKGPPGRVSIGGRIYYPRDCLLVWFAGLARAPRLKTAPSKTHNLIVSESPGAKKGHPSQTEPSAET